MRRGVRPPATAALLVLAAASLSVIAEADVVDASAGSFEVQHSVEIAAAPDEVWEALAERVGEWWESDHTFFGDAAALSIEARPGGCFCERAPAGSVQHMAVVYVEPGVRLRLVGGLGPLQEFPVSGSMTWSLVPAEDGTGTTLDLTYRVAGHIDGGLQQWAEPVDFVLGTQIQRLERLIETGSADPAP